MPEGIQYLLQGIVSILTSPAILHVFWATLLGICVGMLPGLTATLGLTLLTTLTLGMSSNDAILILICMYVGAIYGGSRSAILLNIPGTPASAATSLDGFPLARSGNVAKAMGIATAGSVLGTLIGMVCLAFFAPMLAEFALDFGSFEFFWLAIFGIVISGRLTAADDPIKGWIAGFIGLSVAMVGEDPMHAHERFSFGNPDLRGGFGLLPVLVGVFGFAEILTVMKSPAIKVTKNVADSVVPKVREVLQHWKTIIRSGIMGTFTGIIPGVGEDMGAWASYATAKGFSKEREKYGKGSVEGLMAAETGNSASVPGSIIPVLTLAIPGSAPAAVLLAALFIHGVNPGPLIMTSNPGLVFEIVAMILFASLAILLYGLLLTKPLVHVLRIPSQKLMPIIFVLCTVGAFAVASRVFDIWVMLGFGVLGFILREMKYPMAPLVLGVVLGPILDRNLRRSLNLTDGELIPFLTRPISLTLVIIIVLTLVLGFKPVTRVLGRMTNRVFAGSDGAGRGEGSR